MRSSPRRRYLFELGTGLPGVSDTLHELRSEPWALQRAVLSSVVEIENLRFLSIGIPFPDSYQELGAFDKDRPRARAGLELEGEMRWALSILRLYEPRVNSFIPQQSDIENLIIARNYRQARKKLEAFRDEFGVSLWHLSTSLYVAYRSRRGDGGAAGRELLRATLDEAQSPWIKAFSILIALRADPTAPLSLITAELQDRFGISDLDDKAPRVAFHLRWHSLFPLMKSFTDDLLAANLRMEENYSIVDRYATFVQTLRILSARVSETESKPAWLPKLVLRSSKLFRDPRLKVLTTFSGDFRYVDELTTSAEYASALEQYTIGNYVAAEAMLSTLKTTEHPIELSELKALCAYRTGAKKRDLSDLAAKMLQLESRSPDPDNATNFLMKLALHLEFTGAALSGFVFEKTGRFAQLDGTRWQAVSASVLSPRFAIAFEDPRKAQEYLNRLPYNDSPNTIAFFRAILKNETPSAGIPEERRTKYAAIVAEKAKEFQRAAQLFHALCELNGISPATRLAAKEAEYNCQSTLRNFGECLDIMATELITGDIPSFKRQLTDLIRAVANTNSPEFYSHPSWPITNYFEMRGGATTKDMHSVYSALADFMEANDIDHPNELKLIADRFPATQMIFLLANVCVPEVLDWFIEYRGSEEPDNERVAILDLLEEMDPENSARYEEERTEVTRRVVVQKALTEVDRGKISVDTAGIRKSLGRAFMARVERYLQIRDTNQTYVTAFPEFSVEHGVLVLNVDADGKTVIDDGLRFFSSLHSDVKNRFIFSDEYGLDTSLSVEIRHGIIAGHVRGPFERNHLITRTDAEGHYAPNNYWLDKAPRNSAATGRLHDLLSAFSKKIDDIVEEIKDKSIQVRSRDKPEGLFDFWYDQDALRAARAKSDNVTSLDGFVDAIFDDLWVRTRENLTIVQQHIRTHLFQELASALAEVEAQVQEGVPSIAADFRQQVATCRADVEEELNIIAGWFEVNEASAMSDYAPEVVLHTVIKQIQRLPGAEAFAPVLEIKSKRTFHGQTFRALAKILYLVLENAFTHGDESSNKTTIEFTTTTNRLLIRVSNDTAKPLPLEDLISWLRALEASARGEGEQKRLRQEGRSGYTKLGKLLRQDMGRKNYLVKPEARDGHFTVTIEMELDGLPV